MTDTGTSMPGCSPWLKCPAPPKITYMKWGGRAHFMIDMEQSWKNRDSKCLSCSLHMHILNTKKLMWLRQNLWFLGRFSISGCNFYARNMNGSKFSNSSAKYSLKTNIIFFRGTNGIPPQLLWRGGNGTHSVRLKTLTLVVLIILNNHIKMLYISMWLMK